LSDSDSPPVVVAQLAALNVGLGRMRAIDFGFGYQRLKEADLAGPKERRWAAVERQALVGLVGGQHHVEIVGPYFQGHPEVLDSLITPGSHWPRVLAPKYSVGALLAFVPLAAQLESLGFVHHATDDQVAVFEIPGAWPRASLATPGPFTDADPVNQVADLRAGRALVSGLSPPPDSSLAASGAVSVISYAPEEVRLRAQVNSPGMVVLNDSLAPGWTATVDGRPTRLWLVNLLVRGVMVDVGEHEVVMRYRAPGLVAGLVLSALTAALTALLLARRWPWFLNAGGAEKNDLS